MYIIDWSAIDQQYSEEQRKQRESQDQQQVYTLYIPPCILYTLHVAIQCLCILYVYTITCTLHVAISQLHEPHMLYLVHVYSKLYNVYDNVCTCIYMYTWSPRYVSICTVIISTIMYREWYYYYTVCINLCINTGGAYK